MNGIYTPNCKVSVDSINAVFSDANIIEEV